jgi:hypothetical protein
MAFIFINYNLLQSLREIDSVTKATPMSLPAISQATNTPLSTPTASPVIEILAEAKFIISGELLEAKSYKTPAQQEIFIEIEAYNTQNEIVPSDKLQCRWVFHPEHEPSIRQLDQCQIYYRLPQDLNHQLITVVIHSNDMPGLVTRSIIVK